VFNIALKNSAFYGCMACGKLVLHLFNTYEYVDEEFGDYLSISLSTNIGNFLLSNGGSTKCITLTADLTREGNYPDITKFVTTATKSYTGKGDNIYQVYLHAFDEIDNVKITRSKTMNICLIDGDHYKNGALTATVDEIATTTIVYSNKYTVSESIALEYFEGKLVGSCIIPEYSVKEINYTFYDFFDKKHKTNVKLAYGT
jgi:hypothetical protein